MQSVCNVFYNVPVIFHSKFMKYLFFLIYHVTTILVLYNFDRKGNFTNLIDRKHYYNSSKHIQNSFISCSSDTLLNALLQNLKCTNPYSASERTHEKILSWN